MVEGNREGYINLLKNQICEEINALRESAGKKAIDFNAGMMEFTQKKANASTKRVRHAGIGREEWHNICVQTGYNGCVYGSYDSRDVADLVDNYISSVEDEVESGKYVGSSKYTGMGIGVEQYENGKWFVYYIYCYR